MVERADELFCLRFEGGQTVYELLEQNGHLPLPPYIERAAGADDDTRYQTVYAKHQGAVAAPTAGLHFTDELLGRLKAKGVETAEVTLHVGAGTFQPVRVDKIEEHKMHSEWFDVPPETVAAIEAAHRAHRPPRLPISTCPNPRPDARQRVFGHGTHPRGVPPCGRT